jgi:type I restriction enzyme, S subunit
MHIIALKVPFHKANERGFRHPESKNRSMVKARFRHPNIQHATCTFARGSGEILFSWSGNPDTSIDVFIWDDGPSWLNQHIFRVRENGNADRAFIYFQLKELKPIFAEIARNKQTTGLGHVTAQDMKELMVCDPPTNIAAGYSAVSGPIFSQIMANLLETRSLAQLRDLLLPKLMSGEIRLKDTEKIVEAVV